VNQRLKNMLSADDDIAAKSHPNGSLPGSSGRAAAAAVSPTITSSSSTCGTVFVRLNHLKLVLVDHILGLHLPLIKVIHCFASHP
jgi:hypothetical protein